MSNNEAKTLDGNQHFDIRHSSFDIHHLFGLYESSNHDREGAVVGHRRSPLPHGRGSKTSQRLRGIAILPNLPKTPVVLTAGVFFRFRGVAIVRAIPVIAVV